VERVVEEELVVEGEPVVEVERVVEEEWLRRPRGAGLMTWS